MLPPVHSDLSILINLCSGKSVSRLCAVSLKAGHLPSTRSFKVITKRIVISTSESHLKLKDVSPPGNGSGFTVRARCTHLLPMDARQGSFSILAAASVIKEKR